MFADDTEAHYSHSHSTTAQLKVNNDLKNVERWLKQNGMIAKVRVVHKSFKLLLSKHIMTVVNRTDVRLS